MRALVIMLLVVALPVVALHVWDRMRFRRRVLARLRRGSTNGTGPRRVPVLLPGSVRCAQWATIRNEGTAPAATVTAPSDRRAHHGSTAGGQTTGLTPLGGVV